MEKDRKRHRKDLIESKEMKKRAAVITEVYLDGIRFNFSGAHMGSTIGDLICAVEAHIAPRRRFIMELWLDGRNKGLLWQESVDIEAPLKRCRELRLVTAAIDSLVLQGIYTVCEYNDFICDLSAKLRDALRRKTGETDSFLGAIIESTGEMVKAMDLLYKCGLAYEVKVFQENPIKYYKAILINLSELKDARLSLDNVLLADILEYELTPLLKKMEAKVFSRRDM